MPESVIAAIDARQPSIAVIGGGPAGLMAAEVIAGAGHGVQVFDAMPSVARKFLLAGVGGMNITHGEDYATFVTRYGPAQRALQPILDDLAPHQLREWIHGLGIDTFVGSSKRVFPAGMKAAPLLRAWLQRLRGLGVVVYPRHRWLGWPSSDPQQGWRFESPHGARLLKFDAVVLALGGGSWPRLGSDGQWCAPLRAAGVEVQRLRPSNCGFEIVWSDYVRQRFAGTPIKHVGLSLTDIRGRQWRRTGELVVSDYGIEGSLVYALSAPLRDLLAVSTTSAPAASCPAASLWLDWLPERPVKDIEARLQESRNGMSFANVLRRKLHLPAIAGALLKENCPDLDRADAHAIARALKAMPLHPCAPRPLEEAISSAGGVSLDAVTDDLMLESLPGVFVAGEMLDWEAPTGGYLLTACLATGKRAGEGVVRWLGK